MSKCGFQIAEAALFYLFTCLFMYFDKVLMWHNIDVILDSQDVKWQGGTRQKSHN